jgi:hypothetical protein
MYVHTTLTNIQSYCIIRMHTVYMQYVHTHTQNSEYVYAVLVYSMYDMLVCTIVHDTQILLYEYINTLLLVLYASHELF